MKSFEPQAHTWRCRRGFQSHRVLPWRGHVVWRLSMRFFLAGGTCKMLLHNRGSSYKRRVTSIEWRFRRYRYGTPHQQPSGADYPDIHESAARRARGDVAHRGRGNAPHPIVAGAEHHSVEHRHGEGRRGPHLPGHRHANLRRAHARRRESTGDQARDSRGRRGSHAAGKAASEFGGFADRQEQRRQPGRRDAGDAFRAVGARTRSK